MKYIKILGWVIGNSIGNHGDGCITFTPHSMVILMILSVKGVKYDF